MSATHAVRTLGELRAALADLPDDTPVAVQMSTPRGFYHTELIAQPRGHVGFAGCVVHLGKMIEPVAQAAVR